MTKREGANPPKHRKSRQGGAPLNGNGQRRPSEKDRSSVPAKDADACSGDRSPPPPSLPMTALALEELENFKQLLLQKRRELVGDVDHMENEALRKNRSDASGDLSMMPIHMADIGTDNYEQEFTIGLISSERATLKEIDEALDRVRLGTYGVCLATGKPISKARLKAKPWARYCLAYKRLLEENHRRP